MCMENKEAKMAVAYCQDRKCPDLKKNICGEKGIDIEKISQWKSTLKPIIALNPWKIQRNTDHYGVHIGMSNDKFVPDCCY